MVVQSAVAYNSEPALESLHGILSQSHTIIG